MLRNVAKRFLQGILKSTDKIMEYFKIKGKSCRILDKRGISGTFYFWTMSGNLERKGFFITSRTILT